MVVVNVLRKKAPLPGTHIFELDAVGSPSITGGKRGKQIRLYDKTTNKQVVAVLCMEQGKLALVYNPESLEVAW